LRKNVIINKIDGVDSLARHESRAVARKQRYAAAVLFGLKFADNIHYTSLLVAKLRKPGFRAPNVPVQREFNAKWPFKVSQGHAFWSQWRGDKAISNNVLMLALFVKVPTM